MTDKPDTTRRRLLQLTGGIVAIGLAGCTGTPTDDESSGNTPTATGEHHHDGTETGEHHGTESAHDGTKTEEHHLDEEHHLEEGAHTSGGHGAEGPSHHVEVKMQSLDSGHHFHPHVAWVEPGGTVTFKNASGAHSATTYHPDYDKPLRIPEEAESFDSGLLSEVGATFEHTFDVEGVYDIYCIPHEELGMIGSVIVGEPDPHEQPGLAEPQDEFSDDVAAKIHELNEQGTTMLGHEH